MQAMLMVLTTVLRRPRAHIGRASCQSCPPLPLATAHQHRGDGWKGTRCVTAGHRLNRGGTAATETPCSHAATAAMPTQ